MSHATVKVISLRPSTVPRSAKVAADLFVQAWTAARQLLAGFRSEAEPQGDEAAQVRDLAHRLRDTSPAFANDLLVAVALHESRKA